MILKEDLTGLIKKQPSTKAAREAKALGLRYLGFGRYGDSKGKVAYIVDVEKDRLVPYQSPENMQKLAASIYDQENDLLDAPDDEKGKEKKATAKKKLESEKSKLNAAKQQHRNLNKIISSQLFFKQREEEKTALQLKKVYPEKMFSPDELDSIVKYTKSYYDQVNKYLYAGYEPGEEGSEYIGDVHKIVSDLDMAFEDTEVPFKITTYTGLSDRYSLDNLQKGKEFVFKGYVSTSIHHNVAARSYFSNVNKKGEQLMLQIEVPAGSKGIYLENITRSKKEHEFLLPRGSRIKVIDDPQEMPNNNSLDESGKKLYVIKCQLVQEQEE